MSALLIFERLPVPRLLFSAEIPRVYLRIAAADDQVRVLELPIGVRDGTSSVGDFTARSQYFQTAHHKRLIGGYLSRVSKRRVANVRRDPVVDALIWLSEGRDLDPSRRQTLMEEAPEFVKRATLGSVVIDRPRTPESLRAFATTTFRLELIDSDGDFELYRPQFELPAAVATTVTR